MGTIQLQIPDEVDLKEFDYQMMIASKLYEDGKLSAGQAAKVAGLSKRTFIELLGKYGVSVFGYDFKDIEEDLTNA